MPALFARHCLAAAIAAALSANAVADEIQVTGNSPLTLDGTYAHSLNLSGTASATATNSSWVTASGTFQGDLLNQASVTVNGPSASNVVGSAVHLGGASIAGQFINQGSVTQSNTLGSASPNPSNSTFAITNSSLGRGFENSGRIGANGDDLTALSIDHSQLWSFHNGGDISADGARSTALLIGAGNRLSNDGSNTAYPGNTLYNSGSISAKGSDSVGLKILSDISVKNSGTIQADGVGVDLSAASTYYKQTAGLTAGGVTALKGNFDPNAGAKDSGSHASFEGGAVQGDIRNMWVTEVDGNVSMDAALIQSRYLELGGGRLTLLRPHTRLEGNLELIGSELELPLSNATDPSKAVLAVSGYAEVDPGSKVLLTPKPQDFSTRGATTYRLISASDWHKGERTPEPLAAGDISVSSTSALLTVNSYGFDGNTLVANLQALQGEDAAAAIAGSGAGDNAQLALGQYSSLLAGLPSKDPLFQAFAHADAQQTARLAESLTPELNGGVNSASIAAQRLMEDATQRASRLRTPENRNKGGVWVQALNTDGSQERRQGIDGYDLDANGIAVGADGEMAPGLVAGVAYGYLDGQVKHDNGNKTDISGHSLSLYGNYRNAGFFVDGNLTHSWNDNESQRFIAGTRAKANYDGDLLGLGLLAGYAFDLGAGVTLEPRAGARYSKVYLDGYREKGSSAALKVDAQRYESGELGAGLRLAGDLQLDKGRLTPEATLMAWHDAIGDRVSTTSSFVAGGGSFVSSGVRQARDSYEASLGLDYRLDAVSFGAGYRYQTRSDFDAHGLEARLRYAF